MNQPFIANHSERPAIDVLGDRYTVLLSSEETGQAYSLFEFHVPKGHGSPPHVHSREDESFFVLSGEVDFMIDEKIVRAKAGDVIFGPRGISHNFTGVSEDPARMICFASPGGIEKFFSAVGTPVTDRSIPPKPPTDEAVQKLMQLAPKFGLNILLP